MSGRNNYQDISYPRTGKRGVPQQFPRRLYGMLEGEAKRARGATDCISWSESGTAFHIRDVDRFAAEILPKYFRTSKFSSFQRNLNLYGFTKVKKGPDTDMYAHPAFIRGNHEGLAQLRKATSSSRGRDPRGSYTRTSNAAGRARSVSPSPPRLPRGSLDANPSIMASGFANFSPSLSPRQSENESSTAVTNSKVGGCGRLDLLALALEREGCFPA